ncbi:alpha/beta fold hydrolase [Shouchella patagoniensis]|uniref:alpha/beta fold hydrolase n=1 Tax=Shouchella patagoniensis TaxID=228576 RepID=UPI001475AE53|nr:alpha/beta fold hydrolase [Shouchella patagoniensis]
MTSTSYQDFFVKSSSTVTQFARIHGVEFPGIPTIVFEAGLNDGADSWEKAIIEPLASFTQVVVYDRAGIGKSSKTERPRTSAEMASELHHTLKHLPVEPPYVFVGHSMGALTVRLYASLYEENTAGLVLIDGTMEDYRERFLTSMSSSFQQAYRKQFTAECNYEELGISMQQVKASRRKLRLPIAVLSAGKKAYYDQKAQQLWHELQKETGEISDNSTFIVAKDSAHYIQKDEPELVVKAIKAIVLAGGGYKSKLKTVYDEFADAYASESVNLYNGQYERPAMMQELLVEAREKRVLDAGCAAGWYTNELLKLNAHVSAIDQSPEMVTRTKKLVGNLADVRCSDLSEGLLYKDNSFELILSSLTLHYIKEWNPLFAEFERVLEPGGKLLFSVHHPMNDIARSSSNRYFEKELVIDRWKKADKWFDMPFYRRSLQDILNTTLAHFQIEKVIEPKPTSLFKEEDAAGYARLMAQPSFLIVKAIKQERNV